MTVNAYKISKNVSEKYDTKTYHPITCTVNKKDYIYDRIPLTFIPPN
jgi:hypothetical protein